MKILPVLPEQTASSRSSLVEIWQILLPRPLDQHYGPTLNDTPFANECVTEQHIETGILLCDAVNFLAKKHTLVHADQPGFSACTRFRLVNGIDILRTRRTTGLMTRDSYRMINNIILGKRPEVKQ